MTEKIFVDGMIFKRPHENAPDFIKGRISIKVQALQEFLGKQTKEWVDVDLKESKAGKLYFELNTFQKADQREQKASTVDELVEVEIGSPNTDLPF